MMYRKGKLSVSTSYAFDLSGYGIGVLRIIANAVATGLRFFNNKLADIQPISDESAEPIVHRFQLEDPVKQGLATVELRFEGPAYSEDLIAQLLLAAEMEARLAMKPHEELAAIAEAKVEAARHADQGLPHLPLR